MIKIVGVVIVMCSINTGLHWV